MRFRAKKDMLYRILIWSFGALFLILAIGIPIPVYHQAGIFASLIFLFIFGSFGTFIFWLWFSTYYVITEEHLIMRFGPFRKTIQLNTIQKIEKSYQPIASIALSTERYIVQYNKYDVAIIAPEDIETFVEVINEKITHRVEFKQ